ncbi:MAG TPA: Slp family lipoprotein [Dissulfurispiraceae bacterium]|nr:Slp family lipoprotein [Dissulfurispiraceae bacterium]
MKRFLIIVLLLSLLSGCAHVVSREMRDRSDQVTPLGEIFGDPARHEGRIVILGGIIMSAWNTDEGTYVEVLQKPLDYRGRPTQTDSTLGRFLVLHRSYLDTAIYVTGREVTAAGEVIGRRILPLGEIDYPYLLIEGREIHLHSLGTPFPIFFSIGVGVGF